MSVVSLILILISRPCLNLHTQYQNVLEDIEELHHLGLTVTDLLEIQELTQTVSQEELETVSEVLAGLSEDQVLALADKSSQELDLIINLQWNKSKARRKRSPSPFGLTLTADIRTGLVSPRISATLPGPHPSQVVPGSRTLSAPPWAPCWGRTSPPSRGTVWEERSGRRYSLI